MNALNPMKNFKSKEPVEVQKVEQALASTLYNTLAVWVILSVVLAVVGFFTSGKPGVWGAILGTGIGGAFFVISTLVTLFAAGQPPQIMFAITLGSWLIKVIVLVMVLAILKDKHFYSHTVFGISIIIAIVLVLIVQMMSMKLKKIEIISSVNDKK